VTGEYNGAETLSQITHSTHCIQQIVLWRSSTGSFSDAPCQEGQFVKQKALSLSQKKNMGGIRANSQTGGCLTTKQIYIYINLPFKKTLMIKATDKSCNYILPFSYLIRGLCKEKLTASLQYQKNCSEMKILNICHQT